MRSKVIKCKTMSSIINSELSLVGKGFLLQMLYIESNEHALFKYLHVS